MSRLSAFHSDVPTQSFKRTPSPDMPQSASTSSLPNAAQHVWTEDFRGQTAHAAGAMRPSLGSAPNEFGVFAQGGPPALPLNQAASATAPPALRATVQQRSTRPLSSPTDQLRVVPCPRTTAGASWREATELPTGLVQSDTAQRYAASTMPTLHHPERAPTSMRQVSASHMGTSAPTQLRSLSSRGRSNSMQSPDTHSSSSSRLNTSSPLVVQQSIRPRAGSNSYPSTIPPFSRTSSFPNATPNHTRTATATATATFSQPQNYRRSSITAAPLSSYPHRSSSDALSPPTPIQRARPATSYVGPTYAVPSAAPTITTTASSPILTSAAVPPSPRSGALGGGGGGGGLSSSRLSLPPIRDLLRPSIDPFVTARPLPSPSASSALAPPQLPPPPLPPAAPPPSSDRLSQTQLKRQAGDGGQERGLAERDG